MGTFLLTARLFTAGILVFRILSDVRAAHSSAVLYLAVTIQLVGVVLVVLGYKTRFAALLLAAFCVATTVLVNGHAGAAGLFRTPFLKDLAVAGGFLFMFANGPGPLSLDGNSRGGKPGEAEEGFFMGLLLLAGRILSTLVFLYYGTSKILHTARMQDYMVKHNSHVPTNLIYLAILTQILAPALVLLGYKTRYGALALSGFCIIATSLFHADFGNHGEVEQFLLDFAIAGGLLFMFAHGPGPLSLDARPAKRSANTSPSADGQIESGVAGVIGPA